METITRKRGFLAAPGAIAGMVSEIGYLGDRRLWTRENAADASIDVPRIRAIVSTFARTVALGEDGLVVLDTAPTGHTILLLDAAESYHREVLRQGSKMPEAVRQLLPRLRDPTFTRVLLITLPEATPVHEAKALQVDLARAGIEPFAWVVNQSLTPLSTRDPVLAARRREEGPYVEEVRRLATRVAILPWMLDAPRGTQRLGALLGRPRVSAPAA